MSVYSAQTMYNQRDRQGMQRTVAVMSAEQMSQMYLMPPSVVLTAVFFLMRPMVAHVRAWARDVVPSWARSKVIGTGCMWCQYGRIRRANEAPRRVRWNRVSIGGY
jgi:hypothetical protein